MVISWMFMPPCLTPPTPAARPRRGSRRPVRWGVGGARAKFGPAPPQGPGRIAGVQLAGAVVEGRLPVPLIELQGPARCLQRLAVTFEADQHMPLAEEGLDRIRT